MSGFRLSERFVVAASLRWTGTRCSTVEYTGPTGRHSPCLRGHMRSVLATPVIRRRSITRRSCSNREHVHGRDSSHSLIHPQTKSSPEGKTGSSGRVVHGASLPYLAFMGVALCVVPLTPQFKLRRARPLFKLAGC